MNNSEMISRAIEIYVVPYILKGGEEYAKKRK